MSGRGPELDDWKMSAPVEVGDDEPHERQRSAAPPSRRSLARWVAREHLARRGSAEGTVRTVLVVPVEESYQGTSFTTPNKLFRTTRALPNATVLKNPGAKVSGDFLPSVTGGGMRQKIRQKMFNKAVHGNEIATPGSSEFGP
jgi:hypothetical protein